MNKRNHNLKYHIVYNDIIEKIDDGTYLNEQRLPSEHELADFYNVSRVTIREALKLLEEEQLVTRIKGKGTFVVKRTFEKQMGRVVSFTESTVMLGNIPSSKCTSIKKTNSSLLVQNYLGLNKTDEVWEINRIRYANDLEVLYEESYWVDRICGEITKEIAENSVIAHLKTKGVYLGYGKQEFIALSATNELASLLNVDVGFPLLKSTMSFYTMGGMPIFMSINYYRTDRMSITTTRLVDDHD